MEAAGARLDWPRGSRADPGVRLPAFESWLLYLLTVCFQLLSLFGGLLSSPIKQERFCYLGSDMVSGVYQWPSKHGSCHSAWDVAPSTVATLGAYTLALWVLVWCVVHFWSSCFDYLWTCITYLEGLQWKQILVLCSQTSLGIMS